ncbi:MAG: EAL domain-containing protein [Actinobacteria bacterium]|nr:EAL domain-containing protein [Actinomycetota bacterium]
MPLDRLITALEERGLGTQLTEWVLDHALADAAHWRTLGWDGRVSINVSGRALGEGDLVAQVAHALRRHDLPGEALTLEFPESGLKGLREGSARVLDRLRDMGVRATLDDFGSGTSSLDLLRRFPWDYLKVERSLVTDDAGLAIPLARLCGELGHVVIAEGIETNDQLDEQRLAGVRRGQGYLLAAPLRPEDLQVVLAVGSVVLPA